MNKPASKPLNVMPKKRFAAFSAPALVDTGLRPRLASVDYILFPVHDGSPEAIRKARDTYMGQTRVKANFRQWYSIDISLSYPDTDPEAPMGSQVHYMFNVLPPCRLDFTEMKRFVNRVLEVLYSQLGLGLGSVYASIIPREKVDYYIQNGQIEEMAPSEDGSHRFDDWTVSFLDTLHVVDPATIPSWNKPVQS